MYANIITSWSHNFVCCTVNAYNVPITINVVIVNNNWIIIGLLSSNDNLLSREYCIKDGYPRDFYFIDSGLEKFDYSDSIL